MPRLILARHGSTPYNEMGLWTGLTDVDLSEGGKAEATKAGLILADVAIYAAYVSELRRTASTLSLIMAENRHGQPQKVQSTPALNERDYGQFTGMKKEEVRAKYGDAVFAQIRRSWDHREESWGGLETLKRVHDTKVVPFHRETVKPDLDAGRNVLVISSNNPLRGYVKFLENIPVEEVPFIELGTAEVRIYEYDQAGRITDSAVHPVGDVH